MKEFIITANLYITIQADSEEQALAKFDEFFDRAPFSTEVDWIEVQDEYDIEE